MPKDDPTSPSALDRLSYLVDDISKSREPLDTGGALPSQNLAQQLIEAARYAVTHGIPFKPEQIPAYVDLLVHKDGIDDRKYLLEYLLSTMARLPPDDIAGVGKMLQETVIGILYNSLPHPPDDFVAENRSIAPPPDSFDFLHRSADGSYYNHADPTLGMARTPYARSVPPMTLLNKDELPPPEKVFDELLKRDKFEKHPSDLSSLFFALANIIIHCIFSTDASPGYQRNNVSSYLDLSPLYGSSKEDQDSIRLHDGTGKIANDCFADPRLLFMPPSSSALLVMFSRNHNYIADKLLNINEDRSYSNPPPAEPNARAYQDEKIFQTARLVNCGFFMQIILGDYVAAILGLVRDGLSWRLDPRIEVHESDGSLSQTGLGNVCSIEFNLLYRWHATISESDEAWISQEISRILKGRDPSTVPLEEYKKILRTIRPTGSPKSWTFGGLERNADGSFADADLAKVLMDATEAYASAYKARGTPEALRFVELLSIEQAREWGTCSLNEFRKFMKLKPYATFRDWNPNEEIASAAERLYGTIDKLELHAGLQAEQAKYVAPGAGLCPGYTISRAILSDAVALVRGDPFMTIYNTPSALTNWGYSYTQTDRNDGSYGGILTRMLFTLLPDYYPRGSSYAHFPFIVPDAMRRYAAKWPDNEVSKYSFTRPATPVGAVIVARSYQDTKRVLTDSEYFDVGDEDRLNMLTRDVGLKREEIEATLYQDPVISNAVGSLTNILQKLIREKSLPDSKASRCVDIVKDVLNLLPVNWISSDIAGIGLKTPENIYGYAREADEYAAYAAASTYVFFNDSPAEDWTLREQGRILADKIKDCIKEQLNTELDAGTYMNPVGFMRELLHYVTAENDHNDAIIHLLAEELKKEGNDGLRARESLAVSVFAEYIPTAPIFSKAMALIVNFYLDDSRKSLREQIVGLGATPAILPFIYEALRFDPPMSAVRASVRKGTTIADVAVVPGQAVLASLVNSARDTSVFPNPTQFDCSRSSEYLRLFGFEQRGLLARQYFERIAPVVVYEILKLKNIRRQSGRNGIISRFTQNTYGVTEVLCLDSRSHITPFPASLKINFDET